MKLGVVLPQTEIGDDPLILRDYIQTAEGLGYDYVLCYDHVVGANPDRPHWKASYPYTHQSMFHEPFVTYGYMAAITERIEFVTGILILPQRETALVAKQAAQLDRLSGGRLRLGIGVGWNWVEYEALGQEFSKRGKRSDEQVRVLHELWTKPLVTFNGEFHHLNDVGLNPMPVQQPIPIWFGGGADVVLRRAARLGDGWMPNTMSFEKFTPIWEKLKTYVEAEGRSMDDFGLDVRMSIHAHAQSEWANQMQQWQAAGATHFCINTMGNGLQGAEHIAALKTFWQAMH